MTLPVIDGFAERLMRRSLWFQILVLPPIILCLLLMLLIAMASTGGMGMRDACITPGSSACAIPLLAQVEFFLLPITFILLVVSLVCIAVRPLWGYRLLFLCIVFVIVQGVIWHDRVVPEMRNLRRNITNAVTGGSF